MAFYNAISGNVTITPNTANTIYSVSGGGGGAGQYLTINSGGSNWTSAPYTITSGTSGSGSITMTGNLKMDSEQAIISTKKHTIDIDKLYENLQIVNEMFHIIVPDWKKLESNPTLMDAYQQYDSAKHIEPRYNSEQYIAAFEQYRLLEALTEEQNDES